MPAVLAAAQCLLCFVLLLAAAPAGAEEIIHAAGFPVVIWTPPDPIAPPPVIVYSHGLHGCATQSAFLTRALADAGYLVVAPNHRDATCALGGGAPAAEFANARDRAQDVRRVVAALATDPRWRDRADWLRLGLVGYSLGGDAVLDLAGAVPDAALRGVRAVVALAPYSRTLIAQGALRRLRVPVMYQGGARDDGTTPWLVRPGGSYDQSPAPKAYVELAGVDHGAWTDAEPVAHGPAAAYALAFLDHYLRGAPPADVLTRPLPGVTALRYQAGDRRVQFP